MKTIWNKNYNMDALYKIIVLICFIVFFVFKIKSGEIIKYVHPRNINFIKFTVLFMIGIVLFLVPEVFKVRRYGMKRNKVSLFIVTILMAFFIPISESNTDSFAYEEFKLGIDDSSYMIKAEQPFQSNEKKPIVIDTTNYVRYVQMLYEDIESYKGKEVEITGFIFRHKEFNEEEFVVARMMMVCCAADMQPIGILCRYNNSSELKNNDWVCLKGIVNSDELNGQILPVIEIIQIEKINKPQDEYVYPF